MVSIHTPPWGRDPRDAKCPGLFTVSIHTPPWGRDTLGKAFSMIVSFQFTRPRGGAIHPDSNFRRMKSFNSHAPVGARFRVHSLDTARRVSIHTPPWGRDSTCGARTRTWKFQFTRPRGGAIWGDFHPDPEFEFQFTRPRGGAITPRQLYVRLYSFNSHAPVGARSHYCPRPGLQVVSIHTPPWGRDPVIRLLRTKSTVSIHTPPWGRDSHSAFFAEYILSFNSHAPVGARSFDNFTFTDLDVSIHTPPWGRDHERTEPPRNF